MYGSHFYTSLQKGLIPLDDPRVTDVFNVLMEVSATPAMPSRFGTTPIGWGDIPFDPTREVLHGVEDLVFQRLAISCGYEETVALYEFAGGNVTQLGAFRFPMYDGELQEAPPTSSTSAEIGWVDAVSVPKRSLYPEEAVEILKVMTSLENMRAAMAKMTTGFPIRPSLAPFINSDIQRVGYEAVLDGGILHERSFGIAGAESVSVPWINLLDLFQIQDNKADALRVLEDRIPLIEAARLEAVLSQTGSPRIHPKPGTYARAIEVKLESLTEGATLFYTLDGTTPNITSNVYTSSILLSASGSTIVRAMALAESLRSSPVIRAEFIIQPNLGASDQSSDEVTNRTTRLVLLAVLIPIFVLACAGSLVALYIVRSRRELVYTLSPDSDLVIPPDEVDEGGVVGKGSFGLVRVGNWRGTRVAIKRMYVQDISPRELQQFVDEVSLLRRLRHPNVVIFMGVLLEPRALVTEYMSRGSLEDTIHNPRTFIHPSIALSWAHAMAKGLYFLHQSNIVHGDFKSANVLFDASWAPKIADFGLSKLFPAIPTNRALASGESAGKETPAGQTSSRWGARVAPAGAGPRTDGSGKDEEECGSPVGEVRQTGTVEVGTLLWAAPELLSGEAENATPESDAYSLGVTLWELATRAHLYRGENPLAVILDVMLGRRPNITLVPQSLSELVPVLTGLWAGKPESRMLLSDAEQSLGALYDVDKLVFPSSVEAPVGDVYVTHAVCSGYMSRMLLSPSTEGVHLAKMKAIFEEAEEESRALVVDQGLGFATFVNHSLASARILVEALAKASVSESPMMSVVIGQGQIETCTGGRDKLLVSGPGMDSVLSIWAKGPGFGEDGETGLGWARALSRRAFAPTTTSRMASGIFASTDVAMELVTSSTVLGVMGTTDGLYDSAIAPSFNAREWRVVRLGTVEQVSDPELRAGVQRGWPSTPGDSGSADDSSHAKPTTEGSGDASGTRVGGEAGGENAWLISGHEMAKLVRDASVVPALDMTGDGDLWDTTGSPRGGVADVFDEGLLGAYATHYQRSWNGRDVVVKVLFQQRFPHEVLIKLAGSFVASIRAAGICPENIVGPLCVCLEAPYIGFVVDASFRNHALTPMGNLIYTQPISVGCSVLREIALVLSRVHSVLGEEHGALNPHTIFLVPSSSPPKDGEDSSSEKSVSPVLADFGLGILAWNVQTLTNAAMAAYTTPNDHAKGDRSVTTTGADIYVMGTLLWEIYMRRPVFPDSNHDRMDRALAVGLRIREGNGVAALDGLPATVARIVAGCWSLGGEDFSMERVADYLTLL